MHKKAKSKTVFPVHAIRVCGKTEVAPLIPRIDAKWNGVVTFKSDHFTSGKNPDSL